MKKAVIFAVLVIALLLSGCAAKDASTTSSRSSGSQSAKASGSSSSGAASSSGTASAKTASSSSEDSDDEDEKIIRVASDGQGDDVSFKKLEDYRRDRDDTEKCNLDYPLECAKFLAKDGVVYLTVKNTGYSSKLFEVTLYLDGDSCDPSDTEIEPGQIKNFECYVDPDTDLVSGKLEVEYYQRIGDLHASKTGTLVVLME